MAKILSTKISIPRPNTYFLKNFNYREDIGVFVHPAKESVEYADGGERYILETLQKAADLSSYSQELIGYIKDWPTRYHLSYRRNNLLEGIAELFDESHSVLEIGSGCGSITRWLGEHYKEVESIEGSLSRAAVTRARTKGMDNVKVYCGDVLHTAFDKKYDLVTLIGVLEYLPFYDKSGIPAKDLCVEFLKEMSDSLSESGTLLLAIENQLGLKYFSGCNEDHTGRPFDGISGYQNHSPVTFSRNELEEMLAAAGFTNIAFYHVFPDYKLTETLIVENDETLSLRPYNWIRTPFEDYSGNRLFVWPEFLALKTITDSKLLWHFSNSFLVLASKSDKAKLKADWLIKKFYNHELHHLRQFHHNITLIPGSNGYSIKRSPIHEGKSQVTTQGLKFHLIDEGYIEGELLSYNIFRSLLEEKQEAEISYAALKLHEYLLAKYSLNKVDDGGYPLVSGKAMDCTFWNVIVDSKGDLHFIDRKWEYEEGIPVDIILFRSLFFIYDAIVPFLNEKERIEFISSVMKHIYPQYSEERWKLGLRFEERIQSEVNGKPVKVGLNSCALNSVKKEVDRLRAAEKELVDLRAATLSIKEQNQIFETELLSLNTKLAGLESELHQRAEREKALETERQNLVAANGNLERVKSNLEGELSSIRGSITWRMVMKYQGAINSIFPTGSRLWRAYGRGLLGLRIITTEGPGALFSKVKEYVDYKKSVSTQSDYNQWILKNEPTASQLKQYSRESKRFLFRPKISIITPVYNPEVAWIKSTIESVLRQAYDNWELCLADASTREDIKKFLKKYAKKDPRIKIKFLSQNKGISGNTNEALSLATGEYIGLLDHDDELSPDALYEVVKYLQDHRNADMVYSDEDKINLEGKRIDPFFKPDWSQDMFLSCMYTCHFGVYRKSIIDQIEGFREGYDGSQDYDLVLRVIDKTKNIAHIPKILYHWRMVPGSTSGSIDSKRYAYEAAKRAIKDYMVRNDIKGEVIDGLWVGSYYVKRDLIKKPMVSIIIPTKDNAKVLKNCINSIVKNTQYMNFEIIIVNNNSKENDTFEYFEKLQEYSNVRILDYNENFNFSAINNYAVKYSNGEIILFLNNDTKVITDTWMTSMLEQVQRSEVGAVGCKLLYPDNTVQHAGIILGINGRNDGNNVAANCPYRGNGSHQGYFGRENIIINLSAVTAACMMIRKEVFKKIGGFDENLSVAYNDVDLCIRLRQEGYLIIYMPYAILYHYESLSRGYEDASEKLERFEKEIGYMRKKWASVIDAGDPYYNRNLSLNHGDFRIKI